MNGLDYDELNKQKQIVELLQLKEFEANSHPSKNATSSNALNFINYITKSKIPQSIHGRQIYYDRSNILHIDKQIPKLNIINTSLFICSHYEKTIKRIKCLTTNESENIDDSIFPDAGSKAVQLNEKQSIAEYKGGLENEIMSIFSGKECSKEEKKAPKKRLIDVGYEECYPRNYEEYDRSIDIDTNKMEVYFNSKEIEEQDAEYIDKERVIRPKKAKKLGTPNLDGKVKDKLKKFEKPKHRGNKM